MIFKISLFIVLSIISSSLVLATELYIYNDEFGHKSFSDKPPSSGSYITRSVDDIATLDWAPTPRIIRPKSKRTKRTTKPKSSSPIKIDCQQRLANITKIEHELKTRLQPLEFDSKKQLLARQRWDYRKQCR